MSKGEQKQRRSILEEIARAKQTYVEIVELFEKVNKTRSSVRNTLDTTNLNPKEDNTSQSN